ncbi:GGDEF domain-containing protein [Streptomyces sp. NPDC093109]|uniref:GGDEF domain-containing protein n=1 Tax=Streptomyces sp. NPDC093109 TaxID=3154977 RepID=UPI00344D3F1F
MNSVLHTTGRFGPRTLLITTAAVPLTGWAVHAVSLHRRLTTAQRDSLTGLWRRGAFESRAQRLLDRHDAVVLIADVDHFKRLNDNVGHAAGDRALAVVASRLTEWAGPHGVAGRLGGDEFAVVTRISPRHRDLRITQLGTLLARPVLVHTEHLAVGVSVGAASTQVLGTTDLSTLMRAADTAMYAGKHGGIPVQARAGTPIAPSINGRRAGRPGTHAPGRSAA